MQSKEEVIEDVVERFGAIGAEVVDASVYSSTKSLIGLANTFIVVAYIPGKACFMVCDLNIYNHGSSEGIFTVCGEVPEWAVFANKVRPIERSPVGSETHSARFQINHCSTSIPNKTLTEVVSSGFDFFQSFMDSCLSSVVERFTRHIHLWFVPEYSDEFLEREEEFGEDDKRIYEPFNAKVFAKLPKKIFAEGQSA